MNSVMFTMEKSMCKWGEIVLSEYLSDAQLESATWLSLRPCIEVICNVIDANNCVVHADRYFCCSIWHFAWFGCFCTLFDCSCENIMSFKKLWALIRVCLSRTLSLATDDPFMIISVVKIGIGSIGFWDNIHIWLYTC